MPSPFTLHPGFTPTGDQPEAIAALTQGFTGGARFQTLEGVTGSGKTFTMANVIARLGRPTLVICHNKTLAAQLYSELKFFFPHNAVEFFISYYDYYQPEAYIPQTDTFIEKDSSINEEIERLRLSATNSLLNRDDVIIVASVSCIYGLGSPEDYKEMVVNLRQGSFMDRDQLLEKLVGVQYTRNDIEPAPGTFRVRGDTLEVFPSYNTSSAIRIEFFGDEIESIRQIDPLTGDVLQNLQWVTVSPAKHFVMPYKKVEEAISLIQEEMEKRVRHFESQQKLLEAQRIRMRTEFDIEMLREMGFCSGIENYSRHLSGRRAGERPATLIDYFPAEFLTVVDESHVTLPQVRGMFNGDRARKTVLVEHGFRLPSALDNRPLEFDEFLAVTGQMLFTTATPGPFEKEFGGVPVEQVLRPTGIVDPQVTIRPLKGQIDDLMEEVRRCVEKEERVLVTTLTKRTAEDLTEYLQGLDIRVRYLHSDIDAIERVEILRGLRKKEFDCLIGINLLREGLDLPEVALVAILDADKEGFLRSETSLIQMAGRAARHTEGRVLLYADEITDSMQAFLEKTRARRERQEAYNREHQIVPTAIRKEIAEGLTPEKEAREMEETIVREGGEEYNAHQMIAELEKEMVEAAEALEFERAAILRDQVRELREAAGEGAAPQAGKKGRGRYPTVSRRGKGKMRLPRGSRSNRSGRA